MAFGTFNTKNEYEDKEVEKIYDSISDLRVDLKNKIEELKLELAKLEQAQTEKSKELKKAYDTYSLVDPDDEEAKHKIDAEIEELEDAYKEISDKAYSLDTTIYGLENIISNFESDEVDY